MPPVDNLTMEHADLLVKYLQNVYGSQIVSKDDSEFMEGISHSLDLMGIMDKDTFLDRYTTTIGDTIYTPPRVSTEYTPFSKVRLMVHEHVHVFQYLGGGVTKFCIPYLVSKAERANFEAEAFGAGMEIEHALLGFTSDTLRTAKAIKNYGCGEEEVQQIEAHLDMKVPMIEAGGEHHYVVQIALAFLRKRGLQC